MKKIAVLTSGGDAPGMNACIRAIVKTCLHFEIECIGITDGFQGLIDKKSCSLSYSDVNNIIQKGGTILGTARSKEFRTTEGRQQAISYLKELNVDGLIVIGGDGSFAGAKALSDEFNLPIIGIPGTIDNDIYGTDHTIGYDTALNTVVDAVDKIRDTASSHHRVFFVEVMGRDSGFIALNSAIASGAESVLIPEELTDIQKLAEDIKTHNKGKRGSIIIVAEGDDAGDAVTIMGKVKPLLPDYDLRCTILGHIQRGGNPSAKDRIIATRMGVKAVELLRNGESNKMIGVNGEEIVTCSIEDGIKKSSVPNLSKLDLLKQLRTKNNQ
jgi:6-phosphofructokinase 1